MKRHDIIHRNGKNKEEEIEITRDVIDDAFEKNETFVNAVEREIHK